MFKFWRKLIKWKREKYSFAVIDSKFVSITWERSISFYGPETREIMLAVQEHLKEGHRLFLYDLRKANNANNWGLSFLYGTVKSIQEEGGRVVLLVSRNKFLEALRFMNFESVVTLEFDRETAIASLVGVAG